MKTIGELSADTRAVLERMLAAREGDLISYDEISKIVGRDIRNSDFMKGKGR